MKFTRYVFTAVVALTLGLTSCGSGGDPVKAAKSGGELTKITVGISPFQDTYLPIIGQEKGWFAQVGLDVELKSLAWNAAMPAVISGDVDMAVNNTTSVVSVANADADVVYAYGWNPFTQGSALMIRPNSSLKTLEQIAKTTPDHKNARTEMITSLRGKTIVTTLSTDMGKQINDALRSVGMGPKDVKFVDMDPDAGLAAFLTGTGDAYIGGVPQRAKALAEGMLIGLSGPDLAAPPINGIVTKRDFVMKRQDTLLAFLNVMHRIVRYCDAQTDACGATITNRLNKETGGGLTLKGFKDYWQNIELYAGNAQQAEKMILDTDGVAYWKTTWDGDNRYLVETKAIKADVPAGSNFLMPQVWKAYVAKYGASESKY